MNPERRKSFSARKWWLLIGGGVLLYVVVFSMLERLARPEGSPSEDGSTPEAAASAPAPPQLRRLADGAVEIRHDFFQRSTIRMGNEADEQALYDCLEQKIEETFGEGTEGWSRGRVKRETERIQNECMRLPGLPVPPESPPRPRAVDN